MYRMMTNEQPEFLNGPLMATQNQIAAMIDQQVGGWPVAALTLWRFNKRNVISEWVSDNGTLRLRSVEEIEALREEFSKKGGPETTYQFANEKGVGLDGRRIFSIGKADWVQVMTRDQYYLLRLSPEAVRALKADLKHEVLTSISANLGKL